MPCSIALPLSSEYCDDVCFCPEFEPFLAKIMAGPSKCMRLENEGIHEEIWKEEFRANSEGEFSDDSAMFVKFLSDSEQSDCSDDEHNVHAGSDTDKGRGWATPFFHLVVALV
jgi:hypothetical protein